MAGNLTTNPKYGAIVAMLLATTGGKDAALARAPVHADRLSSLRRGLDDAAESPAALGLHARHGGC